jgi:crossover junction endodeoxyribonuclease RuvC
MGKVKAMLQEFGHDATTKMLRKPVVKTIRKHYLAVDPGQKGGLCVVRFDGTPLEWVRMPAGTPRIIDWISTANGKYTNLVMVAEKSQAMPKQGIVGAFRYGAHFGIFETVAIMLQIPYHEVRPLIWKKALGLTSNKLDSITACRRIFPRVELIPDGCRTPNDGIAEALLISQWARQKNL